MSETASPPSAPAATAHQVASSQRVYPQPQPSSGGQPGIRRQYIAFSFYKLLPEFRRLPIDQQRAHMADLVKLTAGNDSKEMILLSYSCVGARPDVDFMLWKISYEMEHLQQFSAEINRLPLAGYLVTPHHYLAQSKRSTYIDKLEPGHDESRTRIVPGKCRYIFVYPFVKTRDWYLLSKPTRQGIMDEHIAVGTKYGSVKLNTTYSFGLDDQEFVVAFETDHPGDFLDLVQELRETEGSRFTLRDTPIFTCIQTPMEQIVRQLAAV